MTPDEKMSKEETEIADKILSSSAAAVTLMKRLGLGHHDIITVFATSLVRLSIGNVSKQRFMQIMGDIWDEWLLDGHLGPGN